MNKSILFLTFIITTYFPIIINLFILLINILPSKINKIPPIIILINLILIILNTTIKINFFSSSWISIILFLTTIGGLIVIYLYITRIANNEFFYINIKYIIINLIKISPILLIYLKINFINSENNLFNINYFDSYNYLFNLNSLTINSIFIENNKSTYFIILYLYYTIICLINICYKYKAPLRQIIFYV